MLRPLLAFLAAWAAFTLLGAVALTLLAAHLAAEEASSVEEPARVRLSGRNLFPEFRPSGDVSIRYADGSEELVPAGMPDCSPSRALGLQGLVYL